MSPVETVPNDGTDFGDGWEALAAAYFRAAGILGVNEAYDPDELGVPEEFVHAWNLHDDFVAGVYAWINEPHLGFEVGVADAPWVIEWAQENFLGRWESILQWADMTLSDELNESEWGVTWEHHVDLEAAAREADVEFISDGGLVFVFDDRGSDTPASYRSDWLARRQLTIGEIVLAHVYHNPVEGEGLRIPAKVRGKWHDTPGTPLEWKVAVELTEPFGHYEPGDVIVFTHHVLHRQPPGEPWRPLHFAEVTELSPVRIANRRTVVMANGHAF